MKKDNNQTEEVKITTTITLPKAMLQHMSAVLVMPPSEALAFTVENHFGHVDVQNLEPALLNRAFGSEEEATVALHEYCAREVHERRPEQPERVRAHQTRQMAENYLVRCTEYGWSVESGIQATFAE
jgi:hypothetical protein